MEENPIRWFEIYVQDMERAKAFYATLLDVQFKKIETTDIEMWAFPDAMGKYGAAGSLVRMDGVPSGGGGTLVYFGTDDCSGPESRAAQAGGRVFKPKMSIGPHGFISLVYDTEGNLIGLHSMK
jgi:predicted enzyme related to lactoylglutathione lyase